MLGIELLVIGIVTMLVLRGFIIVILWCVTPRMPIETWLGRIRPRYGLWLVGSGVLIRKEPRSSRLFWS